MVALNRMAHPIQSVAISLYLIVLPAGVTLGSEEEDARLTQCAKDICTIIASKKARGPDLSCDLTKTWDKDEIQKGAESKNLLWGLGSAKCSARIRAKRAEIVAAITAPERTFKLEKQSVICEIGTEKYQIRASMAPELKFKDGLTTSVSLHMDDIQGAALVKGVVWTAATLEENFGILQNDMIREVNRFIKKECPKILETKK